MMFRRKPLTINAMQYVPDSVKNLIELTDFIGEKYLRLKFKEDEMPVLILEEKDVLIEVLPGEYIIKSEKGMYAVSKEAFEQVYEPLQAIENEHTKEKEEKEGE